MTKCFYKAHGLFQHDLRLEKVENELYINIKKNNPTKGKKSGRSCDKLLELTTLWIEVYKGICFYNYTSSKFSIMCHLIIRSTMTGTGLACS